MSLQEPPMENVVVDFLPSQRQVRVPVGSTLLQAAQEVGVDLVSLCGGEGRCRSCLILLLEGVLSEPGQAELEVLADGKLGPGFRLACQAIPLTDVRIEVPHDSLGARPRLEVGGAAADEWASVDPPLRLIELGVKPPTLDDARADVSRLDQALAEAGYTNTRFDLPVLAEVSDQLRSNAWSVCAALRGDRVVAILPPGSRMLGLAVDIGTTKLAGYLLDLSTGETLARLGAVNPQVTFGEDVVSRMAYAERHPMGRRILQSRLIETLNVMTSRMCLQVGASPSEILEAVLVGNTAMLHLAAGLPVSQLTQAPYSPAVTAALDLPARDLRLSLAPGAMVHLPPNVAGFVGADHVAVLLSTGVWPSERTSVVVDIGTNTEITLVAEGRMLCCSCASGPAFEGAHVRDGMRAAAGAIERVQFVGDAVYVSTVDGAPPLGICGSGILDVVAGLHELGVLSTTGGFLGSHPRVRTDSGGNRAFVLVPASETGHRQDILVTRRDINEIQLAKAAIRAGLDILMAKTGVNAQDIEDFVVAGAFGMRVHVPSAIQVGMFPELPVARFRQVGNAAGLGARQMLLSEGRRLAAVEIASRIEYVELAAHRSFGDAFRKAVSL